MKENEDYMMMMRMITDLRARVLKQGSGDWDKVIILLIIQV